jgi:hypothetical protein
LRGLFPETLSGLVDYTKSPQQGFLETTRAAILNDESLAL